MKYTFYCKDEVEETTVIKHFELPQTALSVATFCELFNRHFKIDGDSQMTATTFTDFRGVIHRDIVRLQITFLDVTLTRHVPSNNEFFDDTTKLPDWNGMIAEC